MWCETSAIVTLLFVHTYCFRSKNVIWKKRAEVYQHFHKICLTGTKQNACWVVCDYEMVSNFGLEFGVKRYAPRFGTSPLIRHVEQKSTAPCRRPIQSFKRYPANGAGFCCTSVRNAQLTATFLQEQSVSFAVLPRARGTRSENSSVSQY